MNAVYYYDFDITLIDAWRICPAKKKEISNDPPPQQKQYHTHYRPMITEKWALPFIKKLDSNQQASALLPAPTFDVYYDVVRFATSPEAWSLQTTRSPPTLTCMFAISANVPITGNAREDLFATLMSKNMRSTRLKPGLALPVLASAMKTNSIEK
eukprot:645361-Pelagomonas_calceolata.AAC.1